MDQNIPANHPPAAPPPAGMPPLASQPLSPSDERTWAMLAHLTVLLNLVTVILGVIAPLVIYLIYKDRSRYVAFHAMESFVFQLIAWAGAGLLISGMWAVTGALSAILIGVLCVPFALILSLIVGVLPIVALIYGVYGAIEANQGKDFRYWLIGDWVASKMRG
jgi:uncharacterized Tic20 family protein